ncbi:hypothetical protein [Niallia nealsonii]|uniref:Uncharacterized protein n=1 Tax=Niallia nealsonii TaxID=115979 RepID=A0A2N0Z442_9BACI|nr:hypothetical protein [Niallia nealsonii]PKG24282.1 hypothetical protein CWS01_07790 [Niallia nealsonii]
MKIIKTLSDIEELKARGNIDFNYLKALEEEFINWFEAEGNGELLKSFRLPNWSCIYHLEEKDDANFIASQMLHLEYVEKESKDNCMYFRIGIMNDHQMILLYFLEGTFDSHFEQWLQR